MVAVAVSFRRSCDTAQHFTRRLLPPRRPLPLTPAQISRVLKQYLKSSFALIHCENSFPPVLLQKVSPQQLRPVWESRSLSIFVNKNTWLFRFFYVWVCVGVGWGVGGWYDESQGDAGIIFELAWYHAVNSTTSHFAIFFSPPPVFHYSFRCHLAVGGDEFPNRISPAVIGLGPKARSSALFFILLLIQFSGIGKGEVRRSDWTRNQSWSTDWRDWRVYSCVCVWSQDVLVMEIILKQSDYVEMEAEVDSTRQLYNMRNSQTTVTHKADIQALGKSLITIIQLC